MIKISSAINLNFELNEYINLTVMPTSGKDVSMENESHGVVPNGDANPNLSPATNPLEKSELYLRFYVGHKGKYGHEFLEFEFTSTGRLRYANASKYKNDVWIRKETFVGLTVMKELERIVNESEILKESDENWPEPDVIGRQELEIRIGEKSCCLATSKIGSLSDVQSSDDPDGLRVFYYLIQDLKCFVFSLISLHFRIKPV